MEREIVRIDEEKCNGCGLCVPNCHEGALQIIDGKAVLISDLMCDGLGACLGHCPEGALTIEKREATPYNETAVMAEMLPKGRNVVIAHLKHLKDHNEMALLNEGIMYLLENEDKANFDADEVVAIVNEKKADKTYEPAQHHAHGGSCPGSQTMSFANVKPIPVPQASMGKLQSALTHWPIQLHLINPAAAHFQKCDLLVASDCSAFSLGGFHNDLLLNKKLIIACPKLDSNKESYVQKITALIDQAQINTITVAIMEVPCCGGLLQIVQMASKQASRKVPVKAIVVGIKGEILEENWV